MFRAKTDEKESGITTQELYEQLGTTDMLELESEESDAQTRNQQEKGLKY